jgi:glutathione S-transferase
MSIRSSALRLYQVPFSHNCVKVRKALEFKELPFETVDINPVDRRPVKRASGQELVPALVDGGCAVSDSTNILLYLEEAYPERSLLPQEPAQRAECLVLEDWADSAFMEVSRRLAYWRVTSAPGSLGKLFFPRAPAPTARLADPIVKRLLHRRFSMSAGRNERDEIEARRLAELAVARLAGRPYLVGEQISIADITLAAMSAPFAIAGPAVRDHHPVQELLAWVRTILDPAKEFAPAAGAVVGR